MEKVVHKDLIAKNAKKLIEISCIFKLPIILTEHNSRIFGSTIPEIRHQMEKLPQASWAVIEKISFSCFGENEFRKRISETGKKQLIVAGLETHICVAQTVLDAISEGYDVHIVCDATSSRFANDYQIGLRKMEIGGAIPSSTEIVIFELLEQGGTEEFKMALPIIKGN